MQQTAPGLSNQALLDALLAVHHVHLHPEPLVHMLGQVLRAVDAAMLAARAAEAEHQMGEATLQVAGHMLVGQGVDVVEKFEYLSVVLQKTDDGFVQSRELLVGLVAARIVGAAAVENVASAVARGVVGDAPTVGEAINGDP